MTAWAQQPPFDVYPSAEPPYYRVRYEASTEPGELIFPVNYTIWIPPKVKTVRGIIVHQHGCGENLQGDHYQVKQAGGQSRGP